MNSQDTSLESTNELGLYEIRVRLKNGRWWILLSVLVFSAVFAAVAFLSTPMYSATTVVVDARNPNNSGGALTSALGQLGGIASLVGVNVNNGGQSEESMAVLRSRAFTERFIDDQKILPELFYKKFDAAKNQWNVPDQEIPTLAQGFRFFDGQVRRVAKDRITGLIRIEIEWRDPEKAAMWANTLVDQLNAEMRERAITSTNASLSYLAKELANTSEVGIRDAINRLVEAQINQRMLANVTKEYAFRVVDRALPPERGDTVRPHKLLLIALGPLIGGACGIIFALVFGMMGTAARRGRPIGG